MGTRDGETTPRIGLVETARRVPCDNRGMTTTLIVDAETEGLLDLLADASAMRTWEFIRGARAVVTIADLIEATGLAREVVQRQADDLVAYGLLRQVRARKPRRAIGYRAAGDRIVVAFDEHDETLVAKLVEIGEAVERDHDAYVEAHADPDFHSAAGFRFRSMATMHLSPEELAELRRRVLSVVSFMNSIRPSTAPPGENEGGTLVPLHCNQSLSIRLDPLVGKALASPAIITSPRSRLDRWDGSSAESAGLPALTPREREVALALADGLTRAQVAAQLGRSVHTISTLARRLYRKLGVTSQAELTARLAGHDRAVPGEED